MRFEGKNSEIKGFIHGNYKNVPYSVANRHQERLCSMLLASPGETAQFLSTGDRFSGTIITELYLINNNYIVIILPL